MTDNRIEIAGIFGQAAASFDQVGPRSFAHHGRRLVELAGVGAGDRVLDVATGRGACLVPAVDRVGPDGLVLGVDLAGAMLRETRTALGREGSRSPHVARMDAQSLAVRDSAFDRVLCGFAIFFPPNPEQALAECYRVLRPGGTVALSLQACRDPRWAWHGELMHQYAPRPPYPNDGLFASGALARLVMAAGFVEEQECVEPFEAWYADEDEWWASLWSHGSRGELERMDGATLGRFKAEAMARAGALREARGIPQRRDARMFVGRRPG